MLRSARARAARRRVDRPAHRCSARTRGSARGTEPVRRARVLDALGDELANVSRYPIEAYDDFRADVARSLGVHRLRRAGARHAGAHRHGRDDSSRSRATPWSTRRHLLPLQDGLRRAWRRHARSADGRARHRSRGVAREGTRGGREARLGLRSEQSIRNRARAREWEAFLDALPSGASSSPTRPMWTSSLPVGGSGASATSSTGSRSSCCALLEVLRPRRLRLGCAISDEALAGYLRVVDEPFNVNCVALAAGLRSLRRGDEVRASTAARGRRCKGIPHRGAGRRRCGAVPVRGELCARPR